MKRWIAKRVYGVFENRYKKHGFRIVKPDFYCPLVDVEEAKADRTRLWAETTDCIGVDFDEAGHRALLAGQLPALAEGFDYPVEGAADDELQGFYAGNSQFGGTDARVLFAFLRLWRPGRIVEIGSGYSTLLMIDVNRRFLGGQTEITAVEPYPKPFLRRMAEDGSVRLVDQRVQDTPLELFDQLQSGDILFVDSSHVCKTGSDLNFIVFEILPRLRPGVRIHFHDVFLPLEYPENWVLEEERSWNEQYLVRALLMYAKDALRVTFSSAYAFARIGQLPDSLRGPWNHGGSLWLTKGP